MGMLGKGEKLSQCNSTDFCLQGQAAVIAMAKITTSCWSNKLDLNQYCRIGISRGTPRFSGASKGFRVHRKLAPGSWWKSVDVEEYRNLYFRQLSNLDPKQTVEELMALAGEKEPVLLCFEDPKPGNDWCHRGFVATWLYDELEIEIFELGMEQFGCGHSHPKLPPQYRIPNVLELSKKSNTEQTIISANTAGPRR